MKKDGNNNLSANSRDKEKLEGARIEDEKLETVSGGGKADVKTLIKTAVKVLTK